MKTKKKYMAPRVEATEMEVENGILTLSNGDNGISYGGSASGNGINEADGNRNNGWDLW